MTIDDTIDEVIRKLLNLAAKHLPRDVADAIKERHDKENNEAAKAQLAAIIENFEAAVTEALPICQDTGIVIFYVNIGENFGIPTGMHSIITKAVQKATKEIPLRPNTVNPIIGGNPGDNTGRKIPWINWDIVPGDKLEIIAFPKGGGSENCSRGAMLKPGLGIDGVKKFVIDTVFESGAKPCPPNIIGVGIGGGADIAMKIAKAQLLRPIGKRHSEPAVAELEEKLLEAINTTNIGPMGLGGQTTALDVRIDYAMRHPASLPVAVSVQCWAARQASAVISKDGTYEITSKHIGIKED